MKKPLFLLVSLFIALNSFSQEKIILDTDPSYDPDDMGCMAMLHGMANQGACEIVAIMNSTDIKESSVCISAVNHFYNRKAIPVGDYKGYEKKIASPGLYDKHIADNYSAEINSWEQSEDGVALYREILASASDKSITIVIVGTMHNFYGLLKSESCKFSKKTGIELVEEKVKQVVTMGGNFPNGKGFDRANWGGSDELCKDYEWACLKTERNAMVRFVLENCRAPFIASGWEVGCGDWHNLTYGTVFTGQGLKELGSDHIIRQAYEYHFKHRENTDKISRHSNDQCALHYALTGEGENYKLVQNGTIDLSQSGICTWTQSPNRKQGYIQKKRASELIAKDIEALMMSPAQQEDTTPPEAPDGLRYLSEENTLVFKWKEAQDTTLGSWVVYYKIYKNGEFMGKAFGRQYIPATLTEKDDFFELSAVNSSGLESERTKIFMK